MFTNLLNRTRHDFYRKQTLPRDRLIKYMIHTKVHSKTGVFKSYKNLKMSEKVDFVAVKITQILVNIHKKFFNIVRIFYKINCVNIS